MHPCSHSFSVLKMSQCMVNAAAWSRLQGSLTTQAVMHAKRTTALELHLLVIAMVLCWRKLITASMMSAGSCSRGA